MSRRLAAAPFLALTLGICGAACGTAAPASPTAVPSGSAAPSTAPPTPAPIMRPTSSTGAPSARTAFAAGYDPVTHTLIIEGGDSRAQGAGTLAETWSWDGKQWQRLADGPAVENASLTPDPLTGHLLLIGGDAADMSGQTAQTGMWSWDGSSWTRVADNPAEIGVSQAATDPLHKQVLINDTGPTGACGGTDCPTLPPFERYGHYVWDGHTWRTAPTAYSQGEGSARAAMAFDPVSGRVIQQGSTSQSLLDTTFDWDGSTWHVLHEYDAGSQPTRPSIGTAANDGHVLMMLGEPWTNDSTIASTWTFDGTNWQRHIITEPARDSYLVYDAALSSFVAVGSRTGDSVMHLWYLQDLPQGWVELPS